MAGVWGVEGGERWGGDKGGKVEGVMAVGNDGLSLDVKLQLLKKLAK